MIVGVKVLFGPLTYPEVVVTWFDHYVKSAIKTKLGVPAGLLRRNTQPVSK